MSSGTRSVSCTPAASPAARTPCFSIPEAERARILDAVMAPTLAPTVVKRTLGEDDLEGLRVHYAGTATGTAPRPLSLERACPEGDLVVRGVLPIPPELSPRLSAGGETALQDGWDASADLDCQGSEHRALRRALSRTAAAALW